MAASISPTDGWWDEAYVPGLGWAIEAMKTGGRKRSEAEATP